MERTNVFTMDLLEDDVNSLLSQYDTKENKHTGMNHTDQELYKFLMDEEDPRDKSFRPNLWKSPEMNVGQIEYSL